jgi:quinol monooxygenase YgiN
MLQMILRLTVHPKRNAGMIRAFRSLMLTLPAEPGFISCRLYIEDDTTNVLCYMEEWRAAEDLDRQIRSKHWTMLLALMEGAVEPPELRFQWISDEKGLEYLATVRACDA